MKTMLVGCALLTLAGANVASADDTPAPKSDFMASLKQSFRHDYDHEVVRGHFDIGTPPDAHRYYCLIDPKTGKLEENGIAGTPEKRRDGMTSITGVAVSFYNCADAEAKGLLVTSDYQAPPVQPVAPKTRTKAAPPAAPAAAAPSAPAPSVVASSPAAMVPAADERSSRFNTSDPLFTLQSFIDVYNHGDGPALSSLLSDSADVVWVQPDGRTLWGQEAAARALQAAGSAGLQLQFQSQDGRTISLASKTAVLVTKLRLTGTGLEPRIIRCSSVIVPTPKGWRIVSLFMTPEIG